MLILILILILMCVPIDWVEHTDDEGAVFYYNKDTGKSTWEHPMDVFYRQVLTDNNM